MDAKSPSATAGQQGPLVERIRAVLPEIAGRAAETERERKLPRATIDLLLRVGFLQGLVPAERGGGQESLQDWLQSVRLLSSACMSTGWTAGVLGIHAHGMTSFDRKLQDEIWATGAHTLVSTSGAPVGQAVAVEGGVRLSGRFRFSSGSDYASWAVLGFAQEIDGRRARVHALVPRRDYRIEDTWHAAGLKGTGSNDIVAENVFVPHYRCREGALESPALSPGLYRDGLYTLPFHSVWSVMFAGIVLGGAEGAMRLWIERLKTKVKAHTLQNVAEHLPTQLRLAESLLDLRAAALMLEAHWADLTQRAAARAPVSLEDMRTWRAEDAYAARLARRAIDRVLEQVGGSSIYESEPLQRFHRDLHVASQHAYLDCDGAFQVHARDALGLPRDPTLMFS